MRLDEGRRSKREPLGQADVLIPVCREDLEEAHGRVTRVFYVVSEGRGNEAHVARLTQGDQNAFTILRREGCGTWAVGGGKTEKGVRTIKGEKRR